MDSVNSPEPTLAVRTSAVGGPESGEPITPLTPPTPSLYPTPRFTELESTEPSFRYKLVKFLSAVGALFSVPGMITLIAAAVTTPQVVFGTISSVLAFFGSFVQMALAIPVYRAIKQRRRAGFMALLFAQGGTIIQSIYLALVEGPHDRGTQPASIFLSLIWLGILISIKDELDQ